MVGFMKKRITRNALVALAACTALTACSNNPAMMRFESEAGVLLGGQDFGNATMNNTQIMSGEKSYAIDLANRFAAEVITTVHFAFNSSQLDAGAQDALREQANWIRQFPEITFRVFGHADAPGSNGYNKTLGLRRAKAVVAFLSTQGISHDRLEAVSSLGETQPLVATEGRERRNRRAVTEVSGFVRAHQSVLDGKYAQIIYRDYVTGAGAEAWADRHHRQRSGHNRIIKSQGRAAPCSAFCPEAQASKHSPNLGNKSQKCRVLAPILPQSKAIFPQKQLCVLRRARRRAAG